MRRPLKCILRITPSCTVSSRLITFLSSWAWPLPARARLADSRVGPHLPHPILVGRSHCCGRGRRCCRLSPMPPVQLASQFPVVHLGIDVCGGLPGSVFSISSSLILCLCVGIWINPLLPQNFVGQSFISSGQPCASFFGGRQMPLDAKAALGCVGRFPADPSL